MSAIDMTDLLTQVVAGIVAGIVLLFVQPGWIARPDRTSRGSGSEISNLNTDGNQSIIEGNKVRGDISVDQRHIDSSRTTITNNVNNTGGAAASDDDWGKVILILIGAVVAAGLFVLYRDLLQPISYGIALAVFIILLVAVLRTCRLKAWTPRATLSTIAGIGAVLVTHMTWVEIGSVERDGLSLSALASSIGTPTAEQNVQGLAGYFDYFFGTVIPALLDGARPVIPFVLFLMVAAASSVALSIFAWLRLLDWHAFLSFAIPGQRSARSVSRAKSFTEGHGIGFLLGGVLLGVIAVFCAQGHAFDLWYQLSGQ